MKEIEKKSFSAKDAGLIIASLVAIFVGWAANHQATVVTVVAAVLVFVIKWFADKRKVYLGKRWLTIILAAVATILTLIFHPVILPIFPPWTGDAAAFSQALIAYMTALSAVIATITGFATGLYNILLAEVASKVPTGE